MAMHMCRRSALSFLRFASLRQQTTRQLSVLTRRSLLPTTSTLHQSFFVENTATNSRVTFIKLYSDAPSLTVAELEQKTLEVIKSFDKVDPSKVALDAHFINDMGLDSLDIVDMLMAFEDEFGVEISDEQAEKIFTPKEAVEFMKNFLDIH